MRYYIRATGDNRLGDGTSKWLKIRNFTKHRDGYEIEVRIQNMNKCVFVSEKYSDNVEYAEGWPGLKPVSLYTVIKCYCKEN